MNEQVIIGLFTLGGTIAGGLIGGLFSVRAAKIGYKKEKMQKNIRDLANQVKSYWLLEREYLSYIGKLINGPTSQIRTDLRTKVENEGNEYPKMSAKEAMDILKKYE